MSSPPRRKINSLKISGAAKLFASWHLWQTTGVQINLIKRQAKVRVKHNFKSATWNCLSDRRVICMWTTHPLCCLPRHWVCLFAFLIALRRHFIMRSCIRGMIDDMEFDIESTFEPQFVRQTEAPTECTRSKDEKWIKSSTRWRRQSDCFSTQHNTCRIIHLVPSPRRNHKAKCPPVVVQLIGWQGFFLVESERLAEKIAF